jgi:phosphohistidine phosphatase
MKRVWLLRHAKSSWDDPELADPERPLAPRGRKAARRVARWISDNHVRPELVLCSNALRARATLDLVLVALGRPEVEIDDSLYRASAADLLERLHALPAEVASALVVGHNPTLHELAGVLAPPGPEAFPTGALAELRLAVDDWTDARAGCAHLEALVIPRTLPG